MAKSASPPADRYAPAPLMLRLLKENSARHWRAYVVSFALMGLMAACVAISAYLIRHIVNVTYESRDLGVVALLCLATIGLFATRGASDYLQGLILAYVAADITADNQKRVYRRLLSESVGYFADHSSAQILSRFGYSAAAPAAAVNLMIASAGREALSLIALFIVMVMQDPLLSLGGLVFAPIGFLAARKLRGRLQRIALRGVDMQAKLQELLLDSLQGMRLIKAFGLENAMAARIGETVDAARAADRDMQRVSRRAGPAMDALGGVVIALVLLYGSWRIIALGATPGEFVSFLTAFLMAYDPAKRLARVPVDLTASLAGARLLYEFLDSAPSEPDDAAKPPLPIPAGLVAFESVGFQYRVGEPVLKDVSFTAEAGRMTALVGPSGGGKSTIFNLLLRLYEPTQGAVRVDGATIADFSRRSLRDQIAYVGQDAFLFRGSIGQNIAVGRAGATQEEIVAAARIAHAHDFIMTFPKGYDAPVGEHGLQLSSGQRQRVAIARALLRNAPIILLDEPTAALDTISEREVSRAVADLCVGRTTIVIAHRLHTITEADRILVVEDGAIVESGRHADLLRAGGRYAALYYLQTRETAPDQEILVGPA